MGLGGGGQVAWPFRLASRPPPLVPAVTSVTLLTVSPTRLAAAQAGKAGPSAAGTGPWATLPVEATHC